MRLAELTPNLIALIELEKSLREPFHERAYSVKAKGGGFYATVTAGYRNGACPKWAATSDTPEAAVDRAAGHALAYWGHDFGCGRGEKP